MVFRRSSLRVLLVIGLIGASPAGPLIADSGASAAGPGSILYTYDDLGRLSAAVDPAGAIARYTYDAAGNITKITRGTLPNLAVVDVSPSHGPVGSTVSIYGRGFSPTKANDTVKFNGTVATVTSASTSRLAVKVPNGTTTGPVKVTTGGTTATGPVFTVIPSGAPVVSSFSPSIAALGATVTINGQKFQPDPVEDIVAFGAGRASVTSATATRITAKLPTSAASGKVSVTTPFGTGVGTQDLFVPPAPYTPAQVAVATRMTLDSNKVVSVPASKVAMVLFDGAGGARFLLQLTNVTLGSSSCCSATVAVFQPNGSRLVPPQDFGTNGGVVIDTTALPRTGTYALLIDPGTNTGNATLHLKTVPPDPSATITPGGPGVTLNMPSPGQVGRMTFASTAGTRVAMDLS
ncbi:MAG TPA: IPT/TIG domain-containing protein, partial [Actinomycetota bacterium]|nr:IPT/TIG domain-containing protein [Actinomycetota bacterium]